MALMTLEKWLEKTFTKDSRPHPNTARRWILDGKIKGQRFGRSYYVDEAETTINAERNARLAHNDKRAHLL